MENLYSPKYQELAGVLLIRKNSFGNDWKSYWITLSGPLLYKSRVGKTDHKKETADESKKRKILCDFTWTSSCVEVSPVEYVAYRNDQPRPKIKRDFCFKVSSIIDFGAYGAAINTTRSIVYFVAVDQQERTKWIQAITNNIENYKKTTDCVQKHNDLVRAMKQKYGANWNALTSLDATSLNSISPTVTNTNYANDLESTPSDDKESGLSKKGLEMKVMEQDVEISRLKARMEALERTVAELAKLLPK